MNFLREIFIANAYNILNTRKQRKGVQMENPEEEQIEDVDEDESLVGNLFNLSSYGVDYPIESLVNKLNKKTFYIPDFQRKFVWSKNQASRFIESILLGLPVPGIFVFKEEETGKHLVIDGQQRLKSLTYFYNGIFGEDENTSVFKLTGLTSDWNGKTYDTLDEEDKLRLDDGVIHTIVFKQDAPSDNMDSVYEVFERINTGGMKLSPQEIRHCVSHGKFTSLLMDMNKNEDWRAIFGKENSRLKDVELILRFLTFFYKWEEYEKPLKSFLSHFLEENREIEADFASEVERVFSQTISKIHSAIGEKAFRPTRAINAAFFDSVMVGLARRLTENEISDADVKVAYDSLLENAEYVALFTDTTSAPANIERRMNLAIEAFSL